MNDGPRGGGRSRSFGGGGGGNGGYTAGIGGRIGGGSGGHGNVDIGDEREVNGLHFVTTGAKRFGAGRQTVLPFKRLPTPELAGQHDVDINGMCALYLTIRLL